MIVSNLKVTINGNNILNDINFSLNNKDKVGLVGVNGSGKSTLLKALKNLIDKESGSIKTDNESIGYLEQEIPNYYNDYTIIDYIKKNIGIDVLEEKLYKLENNLTEDVMEEYSDVLDKYVALDGYNFEDNLKIILSGLKFNENIYDKISILSGGEKIKVLLSSLLLQNTDILLLDEPTNNLDIEAITWLENYLKSLNKKMIIVSHDEFFLNNIVSKIFELSDGKILEYNLSYNDYLLKKEEEYNQMLNSYNSLKDQKEKLKKELIRAKQWANKGNKKAFNDNDKLANNYAKEKTNNKNISKISSALENLEIPDFKEKEKININLDFDSSKGNRDIILENLVCGYDTFKTPVINLIIPFGNKVMIEGKNGSGKSTLVKTILCEIEPLSGKLIIGNDVRIGYISQDTLSENTNSTILEYLTKDKEDINLSKIFILLDKFNISYEDKDKLYRSLSPGQRTRVNLVKMALDKTNVLVLDEVTNRLDKDALELIYELVQEYKGTIISISHNRKYNEIFSPNIILNIETGKVEYKK